MSKRLLCLALVAGLGCGVLALAQCSAVAAPQDDQRIEELIKKLGSGNYTEREKARHELETIGLPALEMLRQAAKKGDLETKTRCDILIKKLEDKQVAEVLLAPRKVKLDLVNVSVMQAVDELQKQSGYTIHVDGDRVPLNNRKITLQTGVVTFWEAFDLLCEKGQLAEVRTGTNSSYPAATDSIILKKAIQVQPIQKIQVQKIVPPAKAVPVPPVKNDKVPPPAVQPPPVIQEQVIEVQVQIEVPVAGSGQTEAKVIVPVQVGNAQGNAQAKPAAGGVQLPPAQVRPLPAPQPINGKGVQNKNYPAGTIVVRDGQQPKVPTSYHGALRIRLLPATSATEIAVQPRKEGEVVFILDVTPEPRLQQFSVTGSPRVEKAIDDRGVELAVAMDPMPDVNTVQYSSAGVNRGLQRQVALRLKLGDKQAKSLVELKGALTVQALTATPEAVITVDNVEKAIGKNTKGASGGYIEVMTFVKQADGTYKVQIRYQQPPQLFPVNSGPTNTPAIQPAVIKANAAGVAQTTAVQRTNNNGLPVLVDANGKALTLEQIPQRMSRGVNGVVVQEITMIFRAGEGVGAPTQMVLFGHRLVTAEAKFQFANVLLP